jgi:hypothetical protein
MITSHVPSRFVISKLCRRRIKRAHYVAVRFSGRMLHLGICETNYITLDLVEGDMVMADLIIRLVCAK